MDKKCIIDMVKNFNEKLQVYNYMRNVIVGDAEKEMLETFGCMEVEEVIIIIIIISSSSIISSYNFQLQLLVMTSGYDFQCIFRN